MDCVFVVLEERTAQNDAKFQRLEVELRTSLSKGECGTFEGFERGPAEEFIWFDATDAGRLFSVVKPVLLSSGLLLGYAVLTSGETREEVIIQLAEHQ